MPTERQTEIIIHIFINIEMIIICTYISDFWQNLKHINEKKHGIYFWSRRPTVRDVMNNKINTISLYLTYFLQLTGVLYFTYLFFWFYWNIPLKAFYCRHMTTIACDGQIAAFRLLNCGPGFDSSFRADICF